MDWISWCYVAASGFYVALFGLFGYVSVRAYVQEKKR